MSRYIAVFSAGTTHLLTLAQSLAPRVEEHPCGAVILPISSRYESFTLDRLSQLHGAASRIDYAAASSRNVALFAAKVRPGSVIPDGGEESFLSPFPVSFFVEQIGEEVSRDVLDTLFRWGIRSLGQLARLPEPELSSRLGEPGIRLQKLARGEDLNPFRPHLEEPRFEARKDLEWELDGLEPLAFIFGGLLEQICQRLQSRGLATDSIRVWLRLSDGSLYHRSINLAFPMRNAKTLLSLLRLKLQSDPPGSSLTGIRMEAHPARPQIFQYSLLDQDAPHPEAFSRTMARLTALLGQDRLGSPFVLNTHRPDMFEVRDFPPFQNGSNRKKDVSAREADCRNRPRLVLKRIRPPAPTQIRLDQIVACAGPWRSSGEFQDLESSGDLNQTLGQSWAREEWDMEMVDGRVCRVYWDPLKKQWFLEGVYD